MAFSAGTLWRVRTGGAATNGGGFDPTVGVPGTDRSRQDAVQQTYTDIVIGVTTTDMTSAAHPFGAADVGNVVSITSGTGFTVQRVVIISVSGVTATCDKSLGTTASTGGNGVLGGAFILPANADLVAVPGNIVYIEGGAYAAQAATQSITGDGSLAGFIKYIGVAASGAGADADIAESAMPVFTSATNSVAIFTGNGANKLYFRNIKCTHSAATRGNGWANVTAVSTNIKWVNCVTDGCLTGWHLGTTTATSILAGIWLGCVARNSTSTTLGAWYSIAGSMITASWKNCVAHDNACGGWLIGSTSNTSANYTFDNCLSDTNAGDGIAFGMTTSGGHIIDIQNFTCYNSTGSGIHIKITSGGIDLIIMNCVFHTNSAYGINCDTASVNELTIQQNNAFYLNTTNLRNNLSAGNGDIILTGDPFTDAPNRDFSLNFNAGGVQLRSTAYPARIGLSDDVSVTRMSVGAAQPSHYLGAQKQQHVLIGDQSQRYAG